MTKKRILIVEDEPITAMDERQILIGLGYEIAGVATSGEEAVRMAKETKPDLVLMDVLLDSFSHGINVAKEIKDLYDIPIVVVSAVLGKERPNSPLFDPETGFGFISKPFAKQDLEKEIRKFMR